jgi:hypothetical protein
LSESYLIADDLIVTKAGKEIRAKVTGYKDGKVTMLDEAGKEQIGSIANIEEIRFGVMPKPLVIEKDNPTPKEIELNPENYKGRTFVFEKCEFHQDVDRNGDIYSTFITFGEGSLIRLRIDPALVKVMLKDLEGGYYWTDCKIGVSFSDKEPFHTTITSVDVINEDGNLSLSYRIDEQGKGQRFEAKKDKK